MSSLVNKQVVVGVTGGIAAYKSADLVRRLQDQGADVRVVMTRAAQEFVTPLTFQALSGHQVHTELLDTAAEAAMGHIQLARWADLIVVAPASADFIARLCHGQGNDLLTTLCLAAHSTIAIAPAMNQAMWHKASTQDNLTLLKQRGILQLGPATGEQACGDVGLGRMAEVPEIISELSKVFTSGSLANKQVVITAGPTREAIDPVRYLSNHSSGKMGYALAQAAVDAGARTVLISGPTNLSAPAHVQLIPVESAEDMYEQSLKYAPNCHVFIAAAAVADYRPQQIATQKMKKGATDKLTLELIKNPDIVAAVAGLSPKPFTVGFSAETEQLADYAQDKLRRKNLDMIVANDVSQTDIGFNSDDNAVTLFLPEAQHEFSKRGKQQLARDLIAFIAEQINKTK